MYTKQEDKKFLDSLSKKEIVILCDGCNPEHCDMVGEEQCYINHYIEPKSKSCRTPKDLGYEPPKPNPLTREVLEWIEENILFDTTIKTVYGITMNYEKPEDSEIEDGSNNFGRIEKFVCYCSTCCDEPHKWKKDHQIIYTSKHFQDFDSSTNDILEHIEKFHPEILPEPDTPMYLNQLQDVAKEFRNK